MKKPIKKPYECKDCEGSGVTQSENGDNTIECPKCQGKGTYNAYTDN
jgi:DnaJ-class molecular chaperone